LFPKPERNDPPLEVVGTILSVDANKREHILLKKKKSNLYGGTIKLNLSEIVEAAQLCIFALRKSDGSTAGFARHRGSRLAWSPPYEIRFVERPTKGKFLDIRWEDFSNSIVVPENFEDALYYLTAQSEPPILYLNNLVTNELKSLVLTPAGHVGTKALPRDVVFCSIANNAYLNRPGFAGGYLV
jgi:hypothetical protein